MCIRDSCFNRAHGDRDNAPNVAILITDGVPTREVELLHGEVATIKRRGIRIIGVGVTDAVRFSHLYALCTQGRLAFLKPMEQVRSLLPPFFFPLSFLFLCVSLSRFITGTLSTNLAL